MRWLLLVLLLLLVALQYRLWFADGSLAEQSRLEQQVQEQTAVNRQLRERNAVLEREVLELQTGNSTVEQRAREQLGLVRKGETYYQIVEPAEVAPTTAQAVAAERVAGQPGGPAPGGPAPGSPANAPEVAE